MTKHPACGNDAPRPVEPRENREAKGFALAHPTVFDNFVMNTQALRDRQAAYRASLPAEPQKAIQAARAILNPRGEQYPDGFEDAVHLSRALSALLKDDDLTFDECCRDAAEYVAERVAYSLRQVRDTLDRASDVLGEGGRLKRQDATATAQQVPSDN